MPAALQSPEHLLLSCPAMMFVRVCFFVFWCQAAFCQGWSAVRSFCSFAKAFISVLTNYVYICTYFCTKICFIYVTSIPCPRCEIFNVHLRHTPLAADVNTDQLAAATSGYTGADIAAVCREAALAALDEDLQAAVVGHRHFHAALQRVPPSAPQHGGTLNMYERFQRQGRV